MNNRKKSVIVVASFVALIGLVGTMTFNRYGLQNNAGKTTPEAEIEQVKTETKEEQSAEAQSANTNTVKADLQEKVIEDERTTQEQEHQQSQKKEVSFSEKDTLIWPVDGNVIINYSMDQTVYFPTLDQYKYNPALIISGEEGEPVLAAADGIVTDVSRDSEIGEHILLDMGNGYYTIYGQLREIRVAEGEYIEQGQVIGYIDKPTKYFVVEGYNLYFLMEKDGESKNPLEYLEEK